MVTRITSRAQPPEQVVEHLLLAVRGDPVGIEHPLGAEPVDQDEQLVLERTRSSATSATRAVVLGFLNSLLMRKLRSIQVTHAHVQ